MCTLTPRWLPITRISSWPGADRILTLLLFSAVATALFEDFGKERFFTSYDTNSDHCNKGLEKSTHFRFASSTSASEVAFLLVCYSLLFLIQPSAAYLCPFSFSAILYFPNPILCGLSLLFLFFPNTISSAAYLPSVPRMSLEKRQEPLEAGEANPPDDDSSDLVRCPDPLADV